MGRMSGFGIVFVIAFVALLWALAIFNFASVWFGFDLRQYGIIPRTSGGLWGIPLHVFIHANFGHLAANSVPLLILGGLASFRGRGAVFALSAFIALVGGSLVWLLGRTAVHIGASGLVFGYFGYLAARAFYQPGVLSILIAVVVIFFYGWTILFGVLPTSPFVSWEGHLFGLAAGVLYAALEGKARNGRD